MTGWILRAARPFLCCAALRGGLFAPDKSLGCKSMVAPRGTQDMSPFTLLRGTACVLHDALAVKHVFASGGHGIFCVNNLLLAHAHQYLGSLTAATIMASSLSEAFAPPLTLAFDLCPRLEEFLWRYFGVYYEVRVITRLPESGE